MKKKSPLRIRVEYTDYIGKAGIVLGIRKQLSNPIEDAIQIAKNADAAIVCVGFSSFEESEGRDIQSLSLPENQSKLINRIRKVNSNTIVILNSGTPLFINDWFNEVPVLMEAWYPGQEGGRAVADILFGNINPSGKLPQSWPVSWANSPAFEWYPNPEGQSNIETNIDDNAALKETRETTLKYGEDIYVGYRYFDKSKKDPLFPFGYGLSYTKFIVSNLAMPSELTGDSVLITCKLKNVGTYSGSEVLQLYIAPDNSLVDRPEKELKAFKKVFLEPGEAKEIKFSLAKDAFAYYETTTHSWHIAPGKYAIKIGNSSSDIKVEKTIRIL